MFITLSEAGCDDLTALLALYEYLHPTDPLLKTRRELLDLWETIMGNPSYRCVVARDQEKIISTCALTIIPNLTRGARPYGLIENVVTHPDRRGRGIGTAVLRHALGLAWEARCYKVMLLTGRQDEATLRFYEGAGFARGEKTGLIARPVAVDQSSSNSQEWGRAAEDF